MKGFNYKGETKLVKYKTIIISDTHLGKKAASAAFLFEFLQHCSCERLILNGDIIEGWGLKNKKREAFPEMHARCLDGLNAAAANGTEVIYLRGNHDEDWAKRKYGIAGRTIQFSDKSRQHVAQIQFGKSFQHQDVKGRKFLVLHGDVFDGFMRSTKKKVIAQYADRAYEGFVHFNGMLRDAVKEATGLHVSPAAYLKRKTKKILGIIGDFERAVTGKNVVAKFDGVICGHIHHAEIVQKPDILYMNSGDWVEGTTALAEDMDGNWQILDWAQLRDDMKLGSLPTVFDPNPFAEYRGITTRQLSLIRRLWPGSDYPELVAELRDLKRQIRGGNSQLAEIFARGASNDNAVGSKSTQEKSPAELRRKLGKLSGQAEKLQNRLEPLHNHLEMLMVGFFAMFWVEAILDSL